MKYFLDFDRTLFDTDAFNATLADEPGCAPFAEELRAVVARGRDETLTGGADRAAAWKKLNEQVTCGALTFAPGYLARFLYPDVAPALRMLGARATIITFGNPKWQKAKVESALPDGGVEVLYVPDSYKTVVLSSYKGFTPVESALVDDRVAELATAAEAFPELRLYEMRRDGKEGDGRFTTIRSLAELP